jgi:hypothetical protein
MTVQRQNHSNGRWWSSPKGCRKLAGDNIPGHHAIMTSRPGGAPEQLRQFKVLKVIKGIMPKSTVDLGCANALPIAAQTSKPAHHLQQVHLPIWKSAVRQVWKPALRTLSPKPTEPTENRLKLNQIKPKNMSALCSGCTHDLRLCFEIWRLVLGTLLPLSLGDSMAKQTA